MQNLLQQLLHQQNPFQDEEYQAIQLKRWQEEKKKIRNQKMQLYVISKQWYRKWKYYYEFQLEQEIQPTIKPDPVNSDLKSNEKFLFQYPRNNIFNQSIVELEQGDYILIKEDLMQSFSKSYGSDLIITKQVNFDGQGNPELYVNFRKQEVFLQIPDIKQGIIQVDQDCIIKNWIQMLKAAIILEYNIKVEGIRLWKHKHYPSHLAIEQLKQNNGKFHGEILDENLQIKLYTTDLIIIDIQQNGQWQYTYLDIKQASKLEFQFLFNKASKGCGRFFCTKNYCKSNPTFRDIGFDKANLQKFLIELYQEELLVWDQVCWQSVKDNQPIQKGDDLNQNTLKELSKSINSFGASFLNTFEGNYDNLLQQIKSNSALNDEMIDEINQFMNPEIMKTIITNLSSQTIDTFVELKIRAIYIIMNFNHFGQLLVEENPILKVIQELDDEQQKQLSLYVEELKPKYFHSLIHIIKERIRIFLIEQQKQPIQLLQNREIQYIKRMFDLYKIFYTANLKHKKLDQQEFVLEEIQSLYPKRVRDFLEYRQYISYIKKDNDEYYFTFCQYPWAMPLVFKNELLARDSKLSQRNNMQVDIRQILRGQSPFLAIEVDRHNLLETSLKALNKPDLNYKSPMRVIFLGEKGVDEGGPRREFFSLLFQQLFDLNFGMFVDKNNKTVLWFNKDSVEMPICFELIGKLLGLAFYNQILLELKFPPVIYKKLMNEETNLEDLKELDFDAYKGLNTMAEYDKDDFETVFALNFAITEIIYGETKVTELIPNGSNIPVTQQNKKQFIEIYSQYLINGSVETQFSYFKKGFWKVVEGHGIKLFTSSELQKVIVGLQILNMKELEESAEYQGFDKNSDYIRTFWAFIHSLSVEEQKKFLLFCTGSDRVPVGGLQSLKFLIQKHGGGDTDQLPTAHTCFNVFLLPQYDSVEKMIVKLQIALNNCEGFGLI